MKINGKTYIDQQKYESDFGINPPCPRKLKAALEKALDIRKFEIELYWKRASYFWTLIVATFVGYFTILSANENNLTDKNFFAFLVSCIGFLFTFAWFQVNRGSKQWQENWENHVDMLEDKIIGPLYKTVLVRTKNPEKIDFFAQYITGPADFSVSRINQIVNLFFLYAWLALGFFALPPIKIEWDLSTKHIAIGVTTLIFCMLILWKGKGHLGDQEHYAIQRISIVKTPIK
jgi:hypothetical protein